MKKITYIAIFCAACGNEELKRAENQFDTDSTAETTTDSSDSVDSAESEQTTDSVFDVYFNSETDFTISLDDSRGRPIWVTAFPGLGFEEFLALPMRFCVEAVVSSYAYNDTAEFVYGVDCYTLNSIEKIELEIKNSLYPYYDPDLCNATIEEQSISNNYQYDCPIYYLELSDTDGTKKSYLYGFSAKNAAAHTYNQVEDSDLILDADEIQDW